MSVSAILVYLQQVALHGAFEEYVLKLPLSLEIIAVLVFQDFHADVSYLIDLNTLRIHFKIISRSLEFSYEIKHLMLAITASERCH